jgi:TolB protein
VSARDGNWEVYVMNADGSGHRLTRNPAYDGGPAWSPDGGKIAFNRGHEIYVTNADGSGPRNLTRSPWDERGLVWSPARTK